MGHMRSHNNDHEFFCADCETMFSTREELEDHRRSLHPPEDEISPKKKTTAKTVQLKSKIEQPEEEEFENYFLDNEPWDDDSFPAENEQIKLLKNDESESSNSYEHRVEED